MIRNLLLAALLSAVGVQQAAADISQRVVDIPTRPGVTQRFVLLTPPQARAAVILFAGGHGGLQISSDGGFGWGAGNFLVRTREQFARQGLVVAVVDAPSDRQSPPYLRDFRDRAEHVADMKAVISWLRRETGLPVWLIGTSRGTQSAAFVGTVLAGDPGRPDGIVLTSTVLSDPKQRAVLDMPVEKIDVPVLLVHHEDDGCRACPYRDVPGLLKRLTAAPVKELLTMHGGRSVGDPCEARAYHGYNGIEDEVVTEISSWLLAHPPAPAGGPKS